MKNKYIIFIVAAVCLVIGIAAFSAGFILSNFDIHVLSSEPIYIEKTYVTEQEITSVYVQDLNCRVTLGRSTDDKFHVSYAENRNNYYNISENNSELRIEKESISHWSFHIFNINLYVPHLEITVPADFDGDIEIITKNSAIDAKNITVEDLKLETMNAGIDAENIEVSSFRAVTKNAAIKLENITSSGELYAESGNGRIELDEISADYFEIETSNGSIEFENIISNSYIDARTSNAKIEFDDISFEDELKCKTSNGRIEGSLSGKITDYSFDCKTSNARCSLPEGMISGDKKVTLKTSNGAIDVDFD